MLCSSETTGFRIFSPFKNAGSKIPAAAEGKKKIIETDSSSFEVLCRKESTLLKTRYGKRSPYIVLPAENSLSAMIRIYASWLAGYTPVLIAPDATKNEIKDYLAQLPKGTKLYPRRLFGNKAAQGQTILPKAKSFVPAPNKEAVVIFTSGSTGKPKGIVHTFESITAAAVMQNKVTKAGNNSIWLLSLPLYHIGGFMIFFRAMKSGSGLYIAEKSGAAFLRELMLEKEITHVSVVPKQCSELLTSPEVFRKVKCVLLGGGPVEKQIILELRKRKIPTQIIYGSSETAAFCSSVRPEEVMNPKRLGTKPLRGVKFLAVDENKKPFSAGTEGRIVISSPSLFKQYLASEQESFCTIRKNRYYITSDLGYIDEGGFVHITRRADAIIITGGKKVSVSEVEKTLLQIEGVAEVKVFGVKDNQWGEAVCAAIGTSLKGFTEKHAAAEIKKKLSAFKVPKKWLILKELPRTALGKIDTAGLMARVLAEKKQQII